MACNQYGMTSYEEECKTCKSLIECEKATFENEEAYTADAEIISKEMSRK